MPKDRLRPRQPLVAMPRTGMLWASLRRRVDGGRVDGRHDAEVELGPGREVDRDIAAVVDVSRLQ